MASVPRRKEHVFDGRSVLQSVLTADEIAQFEDHVIRHGKSTLIQDLCDAGLPSSSVESVVFELESRPREVGLIVERHITEVERLRFEDTVSARGKTSLSGDLAAAGVAPATIAAILCEIEDTKYKFKVRKELESALGPTAFAVFQTHVFTKGKTSLVPDLLSSGVVSQDDLPGLLAPIDSIKAAAMSNKARILADLGVSAPRQPHTGSGTVGTVGTVGRNHGGSGRAVGRPQTKQMDGVVASLLTREEQDAWRAVVDESGKHTLMGDLRKAGLPDSRIADIVAGSSAPPSLDNILNAELTVAHLKAFRRHTERFGKSALASDLAFVGVPDPVIARVIRACLSQNAAAASASAPLG